MKKKEYDAYVQLYGLSYELRNVQLREDESEEVKYLDELLGFLDTTHGGDLEKDAKMLIRNRINDSVNIQFKKEGVKSAAKLPAKKPVGTCIYAELEARYYVCGKSKWVVLPWIFQMSARSNEGKLDPELFE